MRTLTLTSPSFLEGEWIPTENSARGRDISPELHIDGICENAVSIAITMDDASHPLFPNFNHWLIWNVPVQSVIPAAISKGEKIDDLSNAIQGIAYGRHRYKGPKPPFRTIHTYRFTVYILKCSLSLSPKSRREDLFAAMEGNILQTTTLSGKFQSYRKELMR